MSALQSTTGGADLRVQMNLDHWVQFEGTAAQLIAEGLIPEGRHRQALGGKWL